MFRWFFYDDSIAESPRDDGPGGDRRWGGAETKEAENRRQGGHAEDDSDSETEVGPLLDDLDPTVAAAILTQVSCHAAQVVRPQALESSTSTL